MPVNAAPCSTEGVCGLFVLFVVASAIFFPLFFVFNEPEIEEHLLYSYGQCSVDVVLEQEYFCCKEECFCDAQEFSNSLDSWASFSCYDTQQLNCDAAIELIHSTSDFKTCKEKGNNCPPRSTQCCKSYPPGFEYCCDPCCDSCIVEEEFWYRKLTCTNTHHTHIHIHTHIYCNIHTHTHTYSDSSNDCYYVYRYEECNCGCCEYVSAQICEVKCGSPCKTQNITVSFNSQVLPMMFRDFDAVDAAENGTVHFMDNHTTGDTGGCWYNEDENLVSFLCVWVGVSLSHTFSYISLSLFHGYPLFKVMWAGQEGAPNYTAWKWGVTSIGIFFMLLFFALCGSHCIGACARARCRHNTFYSDNNDYNINMTQMIWGMCLYECVCVTVLCCL
jgi:hypothetical protein